MADLMSLLYTCRGKKLSIDLSVSVLTTGFWPTYKSSDLALPREMVDGVEVFKEFYEADAKHRCEQLWQSNIRWADICLSCLPPEAHQVIFLALFQQAASFCYARQLRPRKGTPSVCLAI